jgi:deoxyribonuclease V
MAGKRLHDWNLSAEEAAQVQVRLREQLNLTWDGRLVRRVAGVDVSIATDTARCAIVILNFPALTPLEAVTVDAPLVFPYIPGLLSFREGPAILAAWDKLKQKPDLLMFDGQGIAHPRGVGIAAQMGLWLGRPTIGVAKSRLYGQHAEPGPKRGDYEYLLDKNKQAIGAVVRTKDNVKPLYVSPGHLMDVPNAVEFTLACDGGYRLPETTRWAHRVAGGESLPPPESPQQAYLF